MRHPVLLLSALFLALPACTGADRVHQVSPTNGMAAESAPALPRTNAANILVTPDKSLGRPVWVVQVLDFHTKATAQDKGFEELRNKAAELGADAVTTAQFEHGDGDEPSHLSGIAVKFAPSDDRPYDVLGEVDIATKEDDDDKGFDQLIAKARALGADEVRFITFDHGAEGGESHLKGTAVKHRE